MRKNTEGKAKMIQASPPLPDEISPAQAFARAREGDRDGFEQLYLHYQLLYKIRLIRLVEEQEIADELYQEAIIRAWQGLPKKQSLSHFERSLQVITTNLALDYLRHRKLVTFQPLPENETDDPKEYMASGQMSVSSHETLVCERDYLGHVLRTLSQQYKICVILQIIWGYSQHEIAQLLGISESAVSSNVSRGMKRLREAYIYMLENPQKGDRHDEKC